PNGFRFEVALHYAGVPATVCKRLIYFIKYPPLWAYHRRVVPPRPNNILIVWLYRISSGRWSGGNRGCVHPLRPCRCRVVIVPIPIGDIRDAAWIRVYTI